MMIDKRIGYGNKDYEEAIASNAEVVRLHTVGINEKMWMDSLGQNLPIVRSGRDLQNYPLGTGKPCLVIGGGPSVTAAKQGQSQLDVLRESDAYQNDQIFIIATDKMLKPCLEKRVYPHLVTSLDGTPDVADFFSGIDLDGLKGEIALALGVITHPDTLAQAIRVFGTENIYWFMGMWDDYREPKSITRVIHWLTGGKVILQTLGNVGALSVFTALHLNAREVAFIGLDYGYPADTPIKKTQYYKAYQGLVKDWNSKLKGRNAEIRKAHREEVKAWEAWRQDMEKTWGRPMDLTHPHYDKPKPPEPLKRKTIHSCYRYVINKDTGAHVLVGLNWDVYRQMFLAFARLKPTPTPLINLSPTSSLWGAGIDTWDLKDWLLEVGA